MWTVVYVCVGVYRCVCRVIFSIPIAFREDPRQTIRKPQLPALRFTHREAFFRLTSVSDVLLSLFLPTSQLSRRPGGRAARPVL